MGQSIKNVLSEVDNCMALILCLFCAAGDFVSLWGYKH
jgi:hypothetical protein